MKKTILSLAVLAGMTTAATAADIQYEAFPDFDSLMRVLMPKYQETHKDVKFATPVMNKHADHHKKLTTNLATGSGAGNVQVVDVGFLGAFINSGGLENLSSAPYEADKLEANFPKFAWTQGKGADGNQYAIPVDIGPGVMYYRQDAMDKVGAKIEDVIKSWDSYIEYGRQLKKEKIFLIADAGDVALLIERATAKPGEGRFFDAQGKSAITSDRMVHAFTIAKKIRDEGLDGRVTAWTNEWYQGFKDGTVATQMSGAWLVGHLKNWIAPDTAGKWRASNLPAGLYGSWGGSFLAIPKQAKDKAAAFEFIKYLTTTDEAQLTAFDVIGAFPAKTSTYSSPKFDEEIAFLGGQKARKLFAEVAGKVSPLVPNKGDLIAEDIVENQAMREVLNENKDIKQALADAEALVKRRVK